MMCETFSPRQPVFASWGVMSPPLRMHALRPGRSSSLYCHFNHQDCNSNKTSLTLFRNKQGGSPARSLMGLVATGETLPGISERISFCAERTVKNLQKGDSSNACVLILMCKGAHDTTAHGGNVAGSKTLGWLGYEEVTGESRLRLSHTKRCFQG